MPLVAQPASGTTPARVVAHADTHDALRGKPSLSMVGLLVVEMVIGYEWFMSGLVKFVRGDFPSGLAGELMKKAPEMAPWYGSFIRSAVIPNGVAFGYAIEIAELLAGIVLIAGPLIWLLAWARVSDGVRSSVLLLTAVATIGATFLAINLHFANGASHPWFLPADEFDEGLDLDSVLPVMQLLIATVSIVLFRRLRRSSTGHPTPWRS